MAHIGQVLENLVTGEVVVFRRTAADTGRELVEFEVTRRPEAAVGGARVHPFQEEHFRIFSGSIGLCADGGRREAGRGDEVTVAAATPHKSWNVGTSQAGHTTEVRAALRFEELLGDHVRRRGRRPHEQARAGEPPGARSPRPGGLRHGEPPLPRGSLAAGGPEGGGAARTRGALRPDLRAPRRASADGETDRTPGGEAQ